MKKFWFKNKDYGYGWYPASPEGWTVLCVYFALLIWLIMDFLPTALAPHARNEIPASLYWYLGKVFLLTGCLVCVARWKGEKPEWRWKGKKIKIK